MNFENHVKKGLPTIDNDTCAKVVAKLERIGVETLDDLSIVVEQDLVEVLPAIKARKLVQSWKLGEYSFLNRSIIQLYCYYHIAIAFIIIIIFVLHLFSMLAWFGQFASNSSMTSPPYTIPSLQDNLAMTKYAIEDQPPYEGNAETNFVMPAPLLAF